MVFELEAEGEVSPRDLMSEIHAAQFSLFGDQGASQNRLKLISLHGSWGLLRCSHTHIEDTRAVLATVYSIGGNRVALRSRKVSGTIKSATEKYLQQLGKISVENYGRRIEQEDVSGCIIRIHGQGIDLCPDDRSKTKGSDTRYLGLTSFDLIGGRTHADGAADGL